MKTRIALQAALTALASTLATAAFAAADSPKASAVYERYFTALGGRAAVVKVESLVVKGIGQEGPSSFDFELALKAPGLILLTASNAGGLNVRQGRDSRARCWRGSSEGVKDLNSKDAGELMNLALAFHLPSQLSLSATLADAECETEREGDRALVAIGKKGKEGQFPRLLFDALSGLLIQAGEVKIDDYRKVEDLRLPFSLSVGWSRDQKGYDEAMAAVDRARKENVFVISAALEGCYRLAFHGLGREAMTDPNQFPSFGPGSWWSDSFWGGQRRFAPGRRLLVPMDARTTASPTGADHYVFYSAGGWSWSVPWIAGLYALACQADPAMTPERFWADALKTGRTIRIRRDSEQLDFGTIVDPVALLTALRPGVGLGR